MCKYEGLNLNSDIARVINKFDIYVCDLGELNEKSDRSVLAKTRPCVIVSSDEIINPKCGQYLVAPIRTEHILEVNKDNLEYIVNQKRELGRIYIPIEIAPNDFRFIDLTQIRIISSSKIHSYVGKILNSELILKINNQLVNMFLSEGEKYEIFHKKKNKSPRHVSTFIEYYQKVNNDEITTKEASKQLGIEEKTFIELLDEYENKISNDKIKALNNQKIGIEIAKKRGVHMGRPKAEMPDNFPDVYKKWKSGFITAKKAIEETKLSSTTFYRIAKKYEANNI